MRIVDGILDDVTVKRFDHQVLFVRVHAVHDHRDGGRATVGASYHCAVNDESSPYCNYERTNLVIKCNYNYV